MVAATAVLHSLGECLGRNTAERLASELPEPLATAVRGAGHGQSIDLPQWVEHVGYRADARPSVAIELSAAVGMALAEALPEHLVKALRWELPEAVAQLVRPPTPIPSPPTRLDRSHRNLAEGEPGGEVPLYAARPDPSRR